MKNVQEETRSEPHIGEATRRNHLLKFHATKELKDDAVKRQEAKGFGRLADYLRDLVVRDTCNKTPRDNVLRSA